MSFREDRRLLAELIEPAGLSVEVLERQAVEVFNGDRAVARFKLDSGAYSVHGAVKALRSRGFDLPELPPLNHRGQAGKVRHSLPSTAAPAFVEPERVEPAPRPAPLSRPVPAVAAAFADAARREPEAAAVLGGVLVPERAAEVPESVTAPVQSSTTTPAPAPAPAPAPEPDPTPAPAPTGPRVLGLELVGVVHELDELPGDLAGALREVAEAGLAAGRPVCLVLAEDGQPSVVVLNTARQLERCLEAAGVAA